MTDNTYGGFDHLQENPEQPIYKVLWLIREFFQLV